MPYQTSLVLRTLTHIFPCASSDPMNVGIRYSALRGFAETSFWKNSTKPSSRTLRNAGVRPPHIHGYQGIGIQYYTVSLDASPSFDNVPGFHNLGQVAVCVHGTDSMSNAAVVRQCIFQSKTCHTGSAAGYYVFVNGPEAFLAVIIVCVDDHKGVSRTFGAARTA